MESEIINAVPQLGIAGAAIYVMYLMYKDASNRFAEKDKILMEQVEKHTTTMRAHQDYVQEVHQSTLKQLAHASKVIEENIKSHERVINYLDKHQ